jgi:acyl-CoA thioesterase-1
MALYIFFSSFLFSLLAFANPKLVFIGDSLTEGYGVDRESAFPSLIEKRLRAEGRNWEVINTGISGSTSASASARMRWVLKSHPQVVFLALGANDALRGFKPEDTEKNLSSALKLAESAKVPVILAGMMAPPNYGKEYAAQFKAVYLRLHKKFKVQFLPFLLEGVAGKPELNQADGIHPNEKGHKIVADLVYGTLKGFL